MPYYKTKTRVKNAGSILKNETLYWKRTKFHLTYYFLPRCSGALFSSGDRLNSIKKFKSR